MTLIQILIILFALFAWSRAFLRLKNKAMNAGGFVFWSIIWIAIILIGIFPKILSLPSSVLGIGQGIDLAIYVSIILLFYLLFRVYVRIDVQNKEITKLVREVAIRDAKKKK